MNTWGFVPLAGRGSLPFALVRGEALVTLASFAVEAAGVELLDATASWADVVDSGRPLLLHDPLCPLTPVGFLRECVDLARERSAVVVGHRPVTDTVKEYAPGGSSTSVGTVGATLDRAGLVSVTSPIVLPAAVVAGPAEMPGGPFAAVVGRLRRRWPVLLVESPPSGRRVHRGEDAAVLEALSADPRR